ncbi:XTP/dITP diphosphatase [Acidianus brierleyi]|uniref:Non-canonical purine NTP pyrophosphatase, RdgB/HAM1 family n=1 Tax=Acidianus brierleyi TaxID=41673 RepID=A0A2U9IEY2_9CREN|nr:XTP/dITP diphosphatase [Acidianus brierleyi]AWR94550.1 XTP/dITP diphosphatase [Acidianus brierleyi]
MLKNGVIKVITSNKHKFDELDEMAKRNNVNLEWINAPKLEIQADSLEEIVRYSASIFYSIFKSPILVDDSGLFIEELNGFPGPYTNFVKRTLDNKGILKLLSGIKNRKAYFETALCYIDDKITKIFSGKVNGTIISDIRGTEGFGFDPIFVPNGSFKTFAEMKIEEKNTYSHRAAAFKKFLDFYITYRS